MVCKNYNHILAREEARKLLKTYLVTPTQLQKDYSLQNNKQNHIITLRI